jgi:hypothetical protein
MSAELCKPCNLQQTLRLGARRQGGRSAGPPESALFPSRNGPLRQFCQRRPLAKLNAALPSEEVSPTRGLALEATKD